MPEYLKHWCFGVDSLKGNYEKDERGEEYLHFGSANFLDNLSPVSLPYPYVDKGNSKAFIDRNGDGIFKEEDNDVLLEELDEEGDNRIFYDETEDRTLFSGFPADGIFLGNVDVVAGQYFLDS